ncbi:hypothetical protein M413DRAFT_187029 [Hebeloma cylindrosporum]|uniref:Uncharacterized protein n=1 Tax=Hebeloma cylindrosporum TaxID=76867 RepID=A0A0C2XQI5_HEBCY|nr:hypothetical protein M413DRAFT_187029 [Hebeloma cylindrosporum h7]
MPFISSEISSHPKSDHHLSSMDVDLRQEEQVEDQDSLFGSPPPSPQITGRPESPSLALPCSGVSGSRSSTSTAPATQNVGTIALPGSHPDSELAINPLALSLSHGVVHRPPALSQRPSTPTLNASRPSVPPTRSSSRLAANSSKPRPKPKRNSRQSSRSSTSEPTQPQEPEFTLPDPSAPPPANFLRNQENLLGRAGLVGGVKPAALTHVNSTSQLFMPGSTPSNPILVDEEDDTPILGRRSRSKEQPYIDPALLTAPTNQEIVAVLIGQKDIFPILEGVLKLVMRSATGETAATTGSKRQSNPKSNNNRSKTSSTFSGHPVKKRKLNRVPAGATDWDVPYPFPEGEGPDAYRKTWERERGKQLISQLIKLIKTAARKAATKKYLQQRAREEEERAKAPPQEGHYRPATASYGLTTDQVALTKSQVLQDASNASRTSRSADTNPAASDLPPTVDNAQASAMSTFDELTASIEALASGQGPSGGFATQPGLNHLSGSRQNMMFSTPTEAPSFGADQPMFDTWMNFLEQFPMSFSGSSDNSAAFSSEPVSHSSTPGLDEFNLMSMMGGNPTSDPSIASSEFDAMMSSMLGQTHMPGNDASMMDNNAVFPVFDTSALEKNIFAPTSGPVGRTEGENFGVIDPSLRTASPIASTSSFGSNDPVTPTAADWDLTAPDVAIGGVESNADGQGWDVGNDVGLQPLSDFGVLPEVTKEIPDATVPVDKGNGRAVDPPPNASPLLSSGFSLPPLHPGSASQHIFQAMLDPKRIVPPLHSAAPSTRKLRKEEILRRAQEKRRLLQEELDKVKMQLWETTIEQASLVQLVKQLDDVERSQNVGS